MIIRRLSSDMLPAFINYCYQHGSEHDDSYTNTDDLNDALFKPDADNPTYVILDEDGRITGAASLMLKGYRDQKKGRFRILHSLHANAEAYGSMLDAVEETVTGIDDLYLFLPEEARVVSGILQELGFTLQRYSWVLERKGKAPASFGFPAGMRLSPVSWGQDEATWCQTINTAFATHAGHIDSTPGLIADYREYPGYLEGGMMLLWDGSTPAGLVRVTREEENGLPYAMIEQLGVMPSYQGKGLGRNLLRAAIDFGHRHSLSASVLTVSAENHRAAELYLSEGFEKIQTMICHNKQKMPSSPLRIFR